MFAAGAGAIKIGAVVAASSILAGAGIDVFAIGGAATAPASFSAGGGDRGGDVAAGMKVEVDVGGGGDAAATGALVGAIAILGATTAGASAGSWTWPSLIWETIFARAKGRSASKR